MKFNINGNRLVINIYGNLYSYPNNDRGYHEMALMWWRYKNA